MFVASQSLDPLLGFVLIVVIAIPVGVLAVRALRALDKREQALDANLKQADQILPREWRRIRPIAFVRIAVCVVGLAAVVLIGRRESESIMIVVAPVMLIAIFYLIRIEENQMIDEFTTEIRAIAETEGTATAAKYVDAVEARFGRRVASTIKSDLGFF